MDPITIHPSFIRFAAVCCLVSVATTIGIHGLFNDFPTDFEQRVLLFRNPMYLFNRWWVIAHCLLATVTMWGFALVQARRSAGFAGLGFLFIVVFTITEIARQMLVLFYVNGLREQYVAAPANNEALRTALRLSIEQFGLVGNAMFGVFVLSIALGNLSFGVSLWNEKGFSKVLSWLLILWSVGSFLALGNDFWHIGWLEQGISAYNITFQPLMRTLIGIWLWREANSLAQHFE